MHSPTTYESHPKGGRKSNVREDPSTLPTPSGHGDGPFAEGACGEVGECLRHLLQRVGAGDRTRVADNEPGRSFADRRGPPIQVSVVAPSALARRTAED